MTRWRLVTVLLLLVLIGVPAALPFLELTRSPQGWTAWEESNRLVLLAGNSLGLMLGTLALALPLGIAGAVLLYRTDLPLRRGLRFLVFLTLFVPLPLFASAWQAALGTGGFLALPSWTEAPPGDPDLAATGIAWKPWPHGVGAAIWVHAVAGLPWVIVLAGQGLCWVEREWEEEAQTLAGPWRVLWLVTLPRSLAAILAAALWVALATLTEITVTDMMQIRTFAEEVYNQLVVGDQAALARAVAVSIPMVLLVWLLVQGVTGGWKRSLPPLQQYLAPPRPFALGWARWPALAGALVLVGILAGIPVASLVWKAGSSAGPQGWSAAVAAGHLHTAIRVRGLMVLQSLALAVAVGGLTATVALLVSWLAVGSRWLQAGVLGLMALVWALSGPLVGMGLKDTIDMILDVTDAYPIAAALYYGPSPLPALWAHFIRFFPCAVAVLWPALRLLPPELHDAARLDGTTPWQEFRHLVLPLMVPAAGRAAFAVAVLSLGEISAGKLVATPGSRTFAQEVFDQMHYGVTNDLAALCLLLLAAVSVLAGILALIPGGRRENSGR